MSTITLPRLIFNSRWHFAARILDANWRPILVSDGKIRNVLKVKIAFLIAHTRNNVVVLFGTLKVQSFMLTEVRDCDLLIVVTSSTFLKRKQMLQEKSS